MKTLLATLSVILIFSLNANASIIGEAEKTAYQSGVAFGENRKGNAGTPVFNVKIQGDSAIIQPHNAKQVVNEADPKPTKEDLLKSAKKDKEKKDNTWLYILLGALLLLLGLLIGYYLSKRRDEDKDSTPPSNGGGNDDDDDCHGGHGNGNGHHSHGNGHGYGHGNHCHD